jgi:hypothetical protein
MNYKNPFVAGHLANTGILVLRSFTCYFIVLAQLFE